MLSSSKSTSDMESSPAATGGGLGGGVGALFETALEEERRFPFRVNIAPAQERTFFCFLLVLRLDGALVGGFPDGSGGSPEVEATALEDPSAGLSLTALDSLFSQICFFLGGMSKGSAEPGLVEVDGEADAEAERGRLSWALLSPKPVFSLKLKAGFADFGLAIVLLEGIP